MGRESQRIILEWDAAGHIHGCSTGMGWRHSGISRCPGGFFPLFSMLESHLPGGSMGKTSLVGVGEGTSLSGKLSGNLLEVPNMEIPHGASPKCLWMKLPCSKIPGSFGEEGNATNGIFIPGLMFQRGVFALLILLPLWLEFLALSSHIPKPLKGIQIILVGFATLEVLLPFPFPTLWMQERNEVLPSLLFPSAIFPGWFSCGEIYVAQSQKLKRKRVRNDLLELLASPSHLQLQGARDYFHGKEGKAILGLWFLGGLWKRNEGKSSR